MYENVENYVKMRNCGIVWCSKTNIRICRKPIQERRAAVRANRIARRKKTLRESHTVNGVNCQTFKTALVILRSLERGKFDNKTITTNTIHRSNGRLRPL